MKSEFYGNGLMNQSLWYGVCPRLILRHVMIKSRHINLQTPTEFPSLPVHVRQPIKSHTAPDCRVTILGKLFTPIVPLFIKQQNEVVALLRVAGVTSGLVESNGILPPGLWLTSPACWLPRTGIGFGTLRSVIDSGLPLPFFTVPAPQIRSTFWRANALVQVYFLCPNSNRIFLHCTSIFASAVNLSRPSRAVYLP